MTPVQKIIKYLSLAFGIYLSISIIGGIIFAITMIFGITTGIDSITQSEKNVSIEETYQQEFDIVENLNIELSACKLNIKNGETIKVEAFNATSDLKIENNNGTLKIKDSGVANWTNLFPSNTVQEITIYLPEDLKLEKIDVDLGATDTSIETINAQKLKLETGAGKCYIKNMQIEDCKVEGGAGEIIIDDSYLGKLDLETGMGRTKINSQITENAKIESGVGKLELNLKGNKDDYKIYAETGLGNFLIDNKKVGDNEIIGDGDCQIKVKAGVGETLINFIEQQYDI